MKNHFLTLALFGFSLLSCTEPSTVEQKDYQLWYDEPATFFEESLVLGNGTMGASVFSGVDVDSIYINDATLWSGEPVNPNMNPDAHKFVPQVRKALKEENYQEADRLIRNIQGSFSQSYAPLGTVYLSFDHDAGKATNYRRQLNISDALAEVSYDIDGTHYTRSYFVSKPDKVMVIKITADKPGSLNFTSDFSSLLKFETATDNGIQKTHGYAPYHAEPSYRTQIKDPIRFDDQRGIHFSHYVKVRDTDGDLSFDGTKISVQNGSYAEIIVSVATSFNGFDKDPVKEGKDHQAIAFKKLENASEKTFDLLKRNHFYSHHKLFDRLILSLLDHDSLNSSPTNERLLRFSEGKADKGLEELYFQFGRYLLISSSQTPEVPANLQGIWNPYMRPPWSSNYTVNINVEENYWLAEAANLSELHNPLLTWIENLAETGKITAETFYGAGGWTVGHNSDIWSMSNPVGDFGQGHPVWANWNMGGAWLSTHLWEHYQYTQDLDFLRDKGFPLMKGAARFCYDMLIQDEHQRWITSPGTSPENLYKTPDGYTGATLYGATADLAIIRELFSHTIKAAELLGVKDEFIDLLSERLAGLHPYQVSKGGYLQEWYHDWEDQDPQHRHQTHLIGLYPGNHITPESTPELAEASKITLNVRGDKSTGWSQGWRINLWARLKDGNRAYKLYRELLTYVEPSGIQYNMANGGGTYPNLLDAHPPFQIDGNFGGAAGVLEMLAYSTSDMIELLPALPDSWADGSISGLRARGGFELSFSWKNGEVTGLKISSENGGKTQVICNGKSIEVSLKPGEKRALL